MRQIAKLLILIFLFPGLVLAQSTAYELDQAKPTDDVYGELPACLGPTNVVGLVCDANDYLQVDVAANSGCACSTYAEDSAHTSTDDGTFVLGVRQDTVAGFSGTEGDYTPLSVTSAGALRVVIEDSWQNSASRTLLKQEDAAASSGDAGVAVLTQRNDTLVQATGDNLDYATLSSDDQNALWVDNIGQTVCTQTTPTVTAAATNYASGDSIGGVITLSNAFRTNINSGTINQVFVLDEDSKGNNLEVCFFTISPTASDNGAFTPTDSELRTLVGCVPVTSHSAFANNGVSQASNVNLAVSASGTYLNAVIIAREAVTFYSATDAISLEICVQQD